MLFYKTVTQNIFYLLNALRCLDSPLKTPFFEKQDNAYFYYLPLNEGVEIVSYEIFDTCFDEFYDFPSPIHESCFVVKIKNVLMINISNLERNKGEEYYIRVTTKENEKFDSKPFHFDQTEDNFVLSKLETEESVFYYGYSIQISLVIAIGIMAGAAFYFF
ncbi:hypothetical protein NBO_30g0001 [Nosema bombycis CQ1]|uniref:Uncharacterized protein n=1 Tax=Nosema bombycis (strain CQ1 / CVCC 102059) TaxID=578461 RepID=R0KVS5_NOSB1|nr:hypothetical protein NBO_30g0001 [Nosema bombycis CQ1]|eukprot:EOB14307.1 hypothetical protein NBO_30g0001 [Nosema bombycis CQ1]